MILNIKSSLGDQIILEYFKTLPKEADVQIIDQPDFVKWFWPIWEEIEKSLLEEAEMAKEHAGH